MEKRVCMCCKGYFIPEDSEERYCCEECKKEAEIELEKKFWAVVAGRNRKRAAGTGVKKLSIDEVCRRAKAEGLSYGKYVGKHGL